MLNHLAGGRLFPGVHRHAKFDVRESADELHLSFRSDDGTAAVRVDARIAQSLPKSSIFQTLEEASEFFRAGSVGFSPGGTEAKFDGLELRTTQWQVAPLDVSCVESSFFADPGHFSAGHFSAGATEFDNALLMRAVEHEWHVHPVPA